MKGWARRKKGVLATCGPQGAAPFCDGAGGPVHGCMFLYLVVSVWAFPRVSEAHQFGSSLLQALSLWHHLCGSLSAQWVEGAMFQRPGVNGP